MTSSRPQVWRPGGTQESAYLPADFYATRSHYLEHLAPVYRALRERGRFCVPERLAPLARRLGVSPSPESALCASDGPIVVAAYADLKRCTNANRHLILFEHGAGFSFSSAHPSYAGGGHERARVSLFCEVNDWTARRNRAKFPGCRSAIVGCPKMDNLVQIDHTAENNRPLVAVSFHWDCIVEPETRGAYSYFASALPALADEFHLILHAHPRSAEKMRAVADALGVEFVEDFADVCARADLYVNDCSSTLYEFAALGRPVVVLNAPWYRRDVHHGLRFWDGADVGVNCDDPADLVDAVAEALADSPERRALRESIVASVYPYLGESAARAAHVLTTFGDFVRTGHLYPERPIPLPEGCCVACDDDATYEDVARWHGEDVLSLAWARDARYVAVLRHGARVVGSLEPAFRALIAGWSRVAIEVPYEKRRGPLFIDHDERAEFYRVGAAPDAPTWLLHPSFALEFE